MKKIAVKLVVTILTILLVIGLGFVVALYQTERIRERHLLRERARELSDFLIHSVGFAMNGGVYNVSPLEEDLRRFAGVTDFRFIANDSLRPNTAKTPDTIEKEVLKTGLPIINFEQYTDNTPVLRVTTPLKAQESCLVCHTGFKQNDTLAAVSLLLSAKELEKASWRFLGLVVGLVLSAWIMILLSLLIALRRVVIKPVRNLRELMEDLAQGEGDLTRRLRIPKKDEIGDAAYWLNLFLDEIQNILKSIKSSSLDNKKISTDLMGAVEQSFSSVLEVKKNIDSVKEMYSLLNEKNTSTSHAVVEISSSINAI
ncbi:MAG: HAMP domain-containing protein, partial [Spirochaetota bacterium]